jgi:hypothetical protein
MELTLLIGCYCQRSGFFKKAKEPKTCKPSHRSEGGGVEVGRRVKGEGMTKACRLPALYNYIRFARYPSSKCCVKKSNLDLAFLVGKSAVKNDLSY